MALFICHWGAHFLSTICYIFILPKTDWNMDENTKLFLEDNAIEELEKRREYLINNWITRIVAIWGGVTGTIALIAQLVQLFQ